MNKIAKTLRLPRYDEHNLFLGSTGSGKTYLAETILERIPNAFIIDPQDCISVEAKKIKTPRNLFLYLNLFKKIRYVPQLKYLEKDIWNYILEIIWKSSNINKKKPKLVYIDELYLLGYGQNFPSMLPKCMSTCRQRQIGFNIATQRPRMIPKATITETTRIFCFALTYDEDIDYISTFVRRSYREEFINEMDKIRDACEKPNDPYFKSFIVINTKSGTFEPYRKITRRKT